jgi:argininosuccinate lyase
MENTGRIVQNLSPSIRRLVFGCARNSLIDDELEHIAHVDQAHVVMLAEQNIVKKNRARRLLAAIEHLRNCHFAPLRGLPAPRGTYLMYEDYLINRFGAGTGGILQTGRSRNDLNATTLRLRLRKPYLRLLRSCLGLQSVLINTAAKFSRVTMPAYTHYQAAVPITYGHYLAGVATALNRDVDWLLASGADMNRCPLGAAAVGGTSWPIDTQRTSNLLGFEHAAGNSVDAVASRDLILRLLAAAAVVGLTLSRMSADLLLWTTSEFGFLFLGDHLTGSSSIMPQKRNPFVLEHVQGRSTSALGAFVTAATCMHAKPFTNSIAVSTEATTHVWGAMRGLAEAVTLARLIVRDAEPQGDAMLFRAVKGQTVATEVANRLVASSGMPFRTAHHRVGAELRKAESRNLGLRTASWAHVPEFADKLDPRDVVEASKYGGGPAFEGLATSIERLVSQRQNQENCIVKMARRWRSSRSQLDDAVRNLLCVDSVEQNRSYAK